jgi:hypothetical protein
VSSTQRRPKQSERKQKPGRKDRLNEEITKEYRLLLNERLREGLKE